MATGTTRVNRMRGSADGVTVTPGTGDNANARAMTQYSGSDALTRFSVRMDKNTIVLIRQVSTTGCTVTIETPFSIDGLDLPDASITFGANGLLQVFSNMDLAYYADTDGDVNFRASAASSVEISAWTP